MRTENASAGQVLSDGAPPPRLLRARYGAGAAVRSCGSPGGDSCASSGGGRGVPRLWIMLELSLSTLEFNMLSVTPRILWGASL